MEKLHGRNIYHNRILYNGQQVAFFNIEDVSNSCELQMKIKNVSEQASNTFKSGIQNLPYLSVPKKTKAYFIQDGNKG